MIQKGSIRVTWQYEKRASSELCILQTSISRNGLSLPKRGPARGGLQGAGRPHQCPQGRLRIRPRESWSNGLSNTLPGLSRSFYAYRQPATPAATKMTRKISSPPIKECSESFRVSSMCFPDLSVFSPRFPRGRESRYQELENPSTFSSYACKTCDCPVLAERV